MDFEGPAGLGPQGDFNHGIDAFEIRVEDLHETLGIEHGSSHQDGIVRSLARGQFFIFRQCRRDNQQHSRQRPRQQAKPDSPVNAHAWIIEPDPTG